MHIQLINHCRPSDEWQITRIVTELNKLGFHTSSGINHDPDLTNIHYLEIGYDRTQQTGAGNMILLKDKDRLLEEIICSLPLDFDSLPLVTEGESKIIKKWTDAVVVEKFKPTVYSYTYNRYGIAPGTEIVRTHFTSGIFRRMALFDSSLPYCPQSAFLAELSTQSGPLIVQRRIEPSNLEVRIKRYHIGSPVHRYKFTEQHSTTNKSGPLKPWSRFDVPLVCFDWRHPLTDTSGARLADEPISDDYASVWMHNVPYAKEMARQTFLWLENFFAEQGIILIDMCLFIDRSGKVIYGEISPDCMRTRIKKDDIDMTQAFALDKDIWRTGKSPEELYHNYELAYHLLFKSQKRRLYETES